MRNKLNCGIYRIYNKLNGDFYIGQSIRLFARRDSHFYDLKRNKSSSIHLQSAWNKYGGENFIFEILLFCDPNDLTYYEQLLVDNWNPKYNICKECVDSRKGLRKKNSTIEKIYLKRFNRSYENYCVTTFGKSLYKILSSPETEEEQKTKEKYYSFFNDDELEI